MALMLVVEFSSLCQSALIFHSLEGIFRVSDKEGCLGFPAPASEGRSDDEGIAVMPDEDPKKCRTTGTSVEGDVENPYGWSNLQFGPNLQIP